MAETPNLLADVTEAFIDRTAIDWAALRSRARARVDSALIENLSALAAIRDAAPRLHPRATSPRSSIVVRLVVAIAAIQTVGCLGVVGLALASGVTADRTPQILPALAFAGAGLLLCTATSRDPRSLFLLAAFTSAASAFARAPLSGLPEAWSKPIEVILNGIFPEAFAPACLWHFALDFPRVRRFTSFDLLARRATAAAWLLGVFLFGVNLILALHPMHQTPWAYLLRQHPSRVFWRLFAVATVPALVAIVVRSGGAPVSERRKVGRFVLAIAAGAAPFLLYAVVPIAFPRLDEWLGRNSLSESVDELVVIGLTAMPILATLAVIVDGPFDLQGFPRARFLRGFLPNAVDHHQHLARALERIRLCRGAREIALVLERELRNGVGAKDVRVLIPEPPGDYTNPFRDAMPLPPDSVLIDMLRETTRPLDLSFDGPLVALLPPVDRDWVVANDAALAAPLKRRDGALAAIVVCGPKRGDARFNRRDNWLVTTLTTAAAAAWDVDRYPSDSNELVGPGAVRQGGPEEVAFECSRCGLVAESMPFSCPCGADAVLASLPRTLAGKFIVQRRVGAGGMGVVYVARDMTLDRDVALKTLPELRPGTVARLRDEARAMAALNHESLATIYGLEVWRRTPVLVVEYFPDGTLAHKLARGPLQALEAVRLGISLARALDYMHSRGVLHRDLKPSNIAFTAAGAPKLLDFGLVGDLSELNEVNGLFAGTPEYLPPEAFRRVPPAPAFDLWALSVIILEAIIGLNPYIADRRVPAHRRASQVDVLNLGPYLRDYPPTLCAFFERALAPAQEKRFQTSRDLQSGLEELARSFQLAPNPGH
jgi:hypothetical protein